MSSTASELAATPITTSARGLAFSASRRAVMTPVESRTQLISMVGLVFLNAFFVGLELIGLECGVHRERRLLRAGAERKCGQHATGQCPDGEG